MLSRLSLLSLVFVAVCACGGTSKASSQASPVAPTSTDAPPTATAAPVAKTVLSPSGDRIYSYDQYLSVTIGPRPAGTASERQAADYIADKLRSFGYDVSFQDFPINSDVSRGTSLQVVAPAQRTIAALPLEGSGVGMLSTALVSAGGGAPTDFPANTKGNIALIQRGDLTFNEKVANAEAAGAAGVIVYNNDNGLFYGSLADQATIPAASISQDEGRNLVDSLSKGPVTIALTVAAPSTATARNVIAKPPGGGECKTVSGGHYDTVPQAPGASDNGSGSSTVIEIADVMADRNEMAGNCFVLFSGEELGLLGSKYFVSALDDASKQALKAFVNYDMVGVGDDGWELIGSSDMQAKGRDVATGLGIDVALGQLPANTGSDHKSFIDAGIPSLMFYRLTDLLLHTPQDVLARVRPDLLEQAARMGVALLESLNGG